MRLAAIRCSFSLAAVISASRNAKCSGIEALMYSLMSWSILSSNSVRSSVRVGSAQIPACKRERGVARLHSEPTFSFTFLDSNSIASSQIKPAPRAERIDRLYRLGICGINIFCAGIHIQAYLPTGAWGVIRRGADHLFGQTLKGFLNRHLHLAFDSYGTGTVNPVFE